VCELSAFSTNFTTSLPWLQSSLVLLPTQDKTEGKFFLQRLRTPSAGSNLTQLLDCSASEPFWRANFGTILLPFLTSGPDLEAWPDCWVSVGSITPPFFKTGRVAPQPLVLQTLRVAVLVYLSSAWARVRWTLCTPFSESLCKSLDIRSPCGSNFTTRKIICCNTKFQNQAKFGIFTFKVV